VFKYTLQTPTTRRDASYKLNVVAEAHYICLCICVVLGREPQLSLPNPVLALSPVKTVSYDTGIIHTVELQKT